MTNIRLSIEEYDDLEIKNHYQEELAKGRTPLYQGQRNPAPFVHLVQEGVLELEDHAQLAFELGKSRPPPGAVRHDPLLGGQGRGGRGEPDSIHPQLFQVVQPPDNSPQVPDTVAVGVLKA